MSLTKKGIENYVNQLKEKRDIRVYTPYKYFQGLTTKKDVKSRFEEIVKGAKSPGEGFSGSGFKTDYTKSGKRKKTRESKYTKSFALTYGEDATSIKKKAEVTGVPYSILKEVYDKGVGAWKTGHRVGATPQQWGYARIHSFVTLGCTALSSDFYLLKKATKKMMKTKKGREDLKVIFSHKISCEKKKLNSEYYKKYNSIQFIREMRKELV